MSEKCKKMLAKYVVTVAICVVMIVFILDTRGFFTAVDKAARILYLADAFTIPGVLILMIGVMLWIATTGIFDGLTYALGRAARSLVPFSKIPDERFYDYKKRKSESRNFNYGFFLIVGGVALAVAIVFTIIHSFIS